MKKVRLFAVAAAMGMFASSVSAATQIGPVVTKTSGSFAWGEFASVMKVDMGDKVVAPQVTVTATTEGRTTDIDYATYKTATGLVKNSTCYVGFTNTVAKDTNIDGLVDMPFYVTDSKMVNGKYIPYASTSDVAHALANYGADTLFGAVVLAPGQGEIDEVYHVAGSEKTFTELTDVFDYLVEEGFFEVTYVDDVIKTISFSSVTFNMLDRDGNELADQPLGTVSSTYVNGSTRAKDSDAVKEAMATLFSDDSNANRTAALQELEKLQTGVAATVTDADDPTDLLSVFTVTHTKTTGSVFSAGNAEVGVNVAAGAVSSTNPYLEDYYYYADTQYYKGELVVGATTTPLATAEQIKDSGAAVVVEYDSRYSVYLPDAGKTATLNTAIQTWAPAILAGYAATAVDGDLEAAVAAKITSDSVAAALVANLPAGHALKSKNTQTLLVDALAAGSTDADDDKLAEGLIEDYFYYTWHLDFHPETTNAKNSFVMPGFVSVIEYDPSNRTTADYSVLVAPKKQSKITKTYKTINDNVFNAETASFDASARVYYGVAIKFANNSANEDVSTYFPYAAYGLGDGKYDTIYNGLYGVGTIDDEVSITSAPENDSEYIVINMPVAGGAHTVTPISRSLSKMTANYKNSVTGEEIMTHLVELDDNNGNRGTLYYPAVETEEDAIKFLETVSGTVISTAAGLAYGTTAGTNSLVATKYTWADGTASKVLVNSALSSPATTQCTYSTNKGADTKTEAASVSFDASKVDTTKAGVYTATLTAKAGETTETKDVTVVVAPKYSRTWDNKGRVSTLKAYWLSGNLYAEYKYTYNADNTITVVSTFYREDGVTVADTATTTK